MNPFGRAQEKYRPKRVRTLLIGESRPVNGTYFYFGDSILFKHTQQAFLETLGWPLSDAPTFLSMFARKGFFLIDLCSVPVNGLPGSERIKERREGERLLARWIEPLSPGRVICVMKAIEQHVRRALQRTSPRWQQSFHSVPFPAQGHQLVYRSELGRLLGP